MISVCFAKGCLCRLISTRLLYITLQNATNTNVVTITKTATSNNEPIVNHETDTKNEIDIVPPMPTPGYLKNVSDRVLKARAKLIDSPYDLEAWNILVKDAQVGECL